MKTSKVKKLCAVALAATLGITVLAGCGSKSADKGTTASKQELTYNLGCRSKDFRSRIKYSIDGAIVVSNAFEGYVN